MRRPLLSIVLAPTSFAAVRTIALRLGMRSTDRQQGRSAGSDMRGRSAGSDVRERSAGCVEQPTSVTIAIAAMMKRNRIVSPYVDEPALGHLPELIDVFTPGDGEWHGVGQFFNQQIGRQRCFLVECAIEGCDHSLFDFRAAETVAGADDLDQIELFHILLPKPQVNLPDGFPLAVVRQVHKKYFIESASAKEF